MEFSDDVSSSVIGLLTLSDFLLLADFKNMYVVIMIYDLDKKKKMLLVISITTIL